VIVEQIVFERLPLLVQRFVDRRKIVFAKRLLLEVKLEQEMRELIVMKGELCSS